MQLLWIGHLVMEKWPATSTQTIFIHFSPLNKSGSNSRGKLRRKPRVAERRGGFPRDSLTSWWVSAWARWNRHGIARVVENRGGPGGCDQQIWGKTLESLTAGSPESTDGETQVRFISLENGVHWFSFQPLVFRGATSRIV